MQRFAYQRGQHGLTGMVLSIETLLGKQPVATVQTALSEITILVDPSWYDLLKEICLQHNLSCLKVRPRREVDAG